MGGLYALGNALVDTEIRVTPDHLTELGIDKGIMTLVEESRLIDLHTFFESFEQIKACGGSAANTLIGAAQLGTPCFHSCLVGDDPLGHFYIGDLIANGVSTHLTADILPKEKTGQCVVMVTPDADRTMNTYLGVSSLLSKAHIDKPALEQATYLYLEGYLVTSPTGFEAMCQAAEWAQAAQTRIALSLSDPALVAHFRPQFETLFTYDIDLLFCNADEAMCFTNTLNLEDAIRHLQTRVRTFTVTHGSHGSHSFDGTTPFHTPALSVKAIDTNGAGDAYAGGFLAALCKGQSYQDAAEVGHVLAGKVVTQFGPRLPLEGYRDVAASLGYTPA